jgi:hypothetical protein
MIALNKTKTPIEIKEKSERSISTNSFENIDNDFNTIFYPEPIS